VSILLIDILNTYIFCTRILKYLEDKWIDKMKAKWWNYKTKTCAPEVYGMDGMSVKNVGKGMEARFSF